MLKIDPKFNCTWILNTLTIISRVSGMGFTQNLTGNQSVKFGRLLIEEKSSTYSSHETV